LIAIASNKSPSKAQLIPSLASLPVVKNFNSRVWYIPEEETAEVREADFFLTLLI